MINWIKNLFKKKEDPIVALSPNNWSVCGTTGMIVYKIPVGHLSPKEAQKQLKQLISNWFTNHYDKIDKIERILNRIQPKEEK